MTETAIDRAWAAAEAPDAGDAEAARFWEVFAGAELHLVIDPASLDEDGPPKPLTFPVEGAETALVFDTEARMAAFMEEGAAHLTLSGRAVVAMFAGTGAQLGLNLGDAPSATVLPASALDWASAALGQPIEAETAADAALAAPRGATPDLLQRIDARLAGMAAAVAEAWLCGLGAGRPGEAAPLILCVALRTPEAERPVVAALAETARFAGGERAAFDIAVIGAEDPRMAAARKVGLGFEPADPAQEVSVAPVAPGGDPSKPPKLR